MSGSHTDDEPDLEREILQLLAERPSHGATWEEILEWWLMERALERESLRVQRALEALVAEGRLRRRRDRRGRTRYEIPGDRPDESGHSARQRGPGFVGSGGERT